MAKILVVDDDDTFRTAIEQNLIAEGHEVWCAANGKIALETFASNPVELIISDIKMPEMDGVELVKALRTKTQVPIILITGFSDIMETQAAHALGANEFIAKPFKLEDLLQTIASCLQRKDQSLDAEHQYCKLSVSDFITGRTIRFNIFLRLSPNNFIKLAHKGEDIAIDRVRLYQEKGLHYLYLKREDFRHYVGFSLKVASAVGQTKSLSLEKKMNLLRHTGEILHEQIRHDGIDEGTYESAATFVKTTMDLVTDNSTVVEILEAMKNHADFTLAHSVGVSLYSVLIAQAMEWCLPTNRLKVAMGGLFHDVGMKEISNEIFQRPRYSWSVADVKSFESHPVRGLSILNDVEGIPADVLEIVTQHHENCQSRGFPSGMKKTLIHPMAKVVAVADEFCYRILKNPYSRSDMTPVEALQDLVTNHVDQLDKKILEVLNQLFGSPCNLKARET